MVCYVPEVLTNLYIKKTNFIFLIGWIGLACVSGLRVNKDYIVWPDKTDLDTFNATDPRRYISKSTTDTYMVIWAQLQNICYK